MARTACHPSLPAWPGPADQLTVQVAPGWETAWAAIMPAALWRVGARIPSLIMSTDQRGLTHSEIVGVGVPGTVVFSPVLSGQPQADCSKGLGEAISQHRAWARWRLWPSSRKPWS